MSQRLGKELVLEERARAVDAPMFLRLAANQIDTAMGEASTAFGGLTAAVLELAGAARAGGGGDEATADALTRLQAVDRLEQRLAHVTQDLRALSALLAASGGAAAEWRSFLAAVRDRYTTDAERVEFDQVFGAS